MLLLFAGLSISLFIILVIFLWFFLLFLLHQIVFCDQILTVKN